jgi:hypothetical protein
MLEVGLTNQSSLSVRTAAVVGRGKTIEANRANPTSGKVVERCAPDTTGAHYNRVVVFCDRHAARAVE